MKQKILPEKQATVKQGDISPGMQKALNAVIQEINFINTGVEDVINSVRVIADINITYNPGSRKLPPVNLQVKKMKVYKNQKNYIQELG